MKFQIELSVHRLSEQAVSTQYRSDNKSTEFSYWGREDEYRRWSQDVKDRASKIRPVTRDEAWSFIIDPRSLWIWQIAAAYCSELSFSHWQESIVGQRNTSSPFVKFGQQLLNIAAAVNVDDLSKLSEIVDAIELQLSVLGSFGDLYHRRVVGGDDIEYEQFHWNQDIRRRIHSTVKDANVQKAASRNGIRSHLQHHEDNLLLQAIVCTVLLACIYPLYRALKSSSSSPGSASEADFCMQIVNSIIQLTGFLTLLLPIYRETAAKEWIGTWVLTILGSISAIIAVPLYLSAPILWSAFFSWLAASAQLLVVLQLAMVAAFRNQQHVKQT